MRNNHSKVLKKKIVCMYINLKNVMNVWKKEHQVQIDISKPIIISWERIYNNKHKIRFEYENEFIFHILDYSKAVEFVSVRFLDEGLKEKDSSVHQVDDTPIEEIINKC
jgi:hypothetical protein